MSIEKTNDEINASGRRAFIKNTAIAAAAFMIVPRHVLGGKGFLAPSDRLIVAGIGAGGKEHLTLQILLKAEKQILDSCVM